MHFNDSKKELATRVDRHDNIGKGFLGEDVFRMLMNDSRFDNMPLILETPEESLWEAEIKNLYSLVRSKYFRILIHTNLFRDYVNINFLEFFICCIIANLK